MKNENEVMPLPLHQASLGQDKPWERGTEIVCGCSHHFELWDIRCPSCREKNPFHRVRKKRKSIEQFLQSKIDEESSDGLQKAEILSELAGRYHFNLSEFLRLPFPKRQKKEAIQFFIKRVLSFFRGMFKSTSPKRFSKEIADGISRSARAMSYFSLRDSRRIFAEISGVYLSQPTETQVDAQAEMIEKDLWSLVEPYMDSLKALQWFYSKVVAAYRPVHPILIRDHSTKGGKAVWNKARSFMTSVGPLLRFGTAIWRDSEEKNQLQTLDAALRRFYEQAKKFCEQHKTLVKSNGVLLRTYQLSLRKSIIQAMVQCASRASPGGRREISLQLLGQKGIQSFWRRWLRLRG